ncbi:MAG TPA: PRC-barrel domain-containing protein [Oligoflexus sp.]|uniref:PRC-barrel domain-containing protein n=1 Tax=Oligoflexus sp. TaxID=1971216 RepID=UPI002D5D2F5D|nr:PRC-barrel domain-containing protein [Oligoflexus sp.]HYX37377.1 PRC-barrel domain-containing protein [Oligoflexus sp.]
MLYRAGAILNQKVEANDGIVGVVKDLYFDDVAWTLRYLVVDTGGWLTGSDVLISSEAVVEFNQERSTLVTRLSQLQIENSPPADKGQPVSRLNEMQLSQYYGWSPYWTAPNGLFPWSKTYTFPRHPSVPDGGPTSPNFEAEFERQSQTDPNLRSFVSLKNYGLRAADGDIGQVEDLLIEPESWRITHMIVDARLWWPGGLVAIDRGMIEDIMWSDHKIVVAMTRKQVEDAPAYSKEGALDEDYQTQLSTYYQTLQPTYQTPGATDTSRHSWAGQQSGFQNI